MENKNRRNHFRVEMAVPVRWRILSKEETTLVKTGFGSNLFRMEGLPSPIDEFLKKASPGSMEEQLYRSLQYLNNKLDFIIEQLMHNFAEIEWGQDNLIELSASGLKFTTRERLDKGIFLKVDMVMPGTIKYKLELVAEVMRVKNIDEGYMIAAHIVHIDNEARDSIVKMVFQKQRMDIRRLKSEKEDEIIA